MSASRATPALFVTLGMLYFAQGLPAGLLGKSMPALARDAGLGRSVEQALQGPWTRA